MHVGDRESDIYELFCTAQELGTHFVVRSCVDRLAGDGDHTIADEMDEVQVQGVHSVEVRDSKGRVGAAAVELRYRRIRVLPPIGKQKRYPALALTVIYARERDAPPDRPAIDWKLITDLPVTSCEEAIEKLRWYALRWKIEVFHKILKSGCRAEEARLRTAERLVKLIAVFCILSWRVFWMTMINRVRAERRPTARAHHWRDRDPGPSRARQRTGPEETLLLPDQGRTARRLSRADPRPAAGEHRHVARPLSAHRHRARRRARKGRAAMWVIESLTGGLP